MVNRSTIMKPAHRRYNLLFTKINPEECKFHIHTLVYYGIKIWKQTLNVKGFNNNHYITKEISGGSHNLPKEIVETWEPVFEPLPIEQPKESDFKAKVIELIETKINDLKGYEKRQIERNEYYNNHSQVASKIKVYNDLINQIKQL